VAIDFRKNYPLLLIFLGFVFISFTGGYRIYSQRILSFSTTPKSFQKGDTGDQNKNIPGRINIPKVNISLPVDISTIENGVWQISDTRASFLDISAGLGQGGNTVIYGHNKTSIFGPIRWLKKGDEIELIDRAGESHKYEIAETVVVNPDAIDYVEPKDKETLTIYTCTGVFDSKRFIIVAYPKEVR